MFPYWRYVRYTDDGCAIYQCLDCKNSWESRTSPGWFNSFEEVDGPGEGLTEFSRTVDGVEVPYWNKKRETPVYQPVFNFCPFCGLKWEGPIRCDDDNEYMYGPKRLARQQAIAQVKRNRKFDWVEHLPRWWWVIQRREIWPDRPEPEQWLDVYKINPNKHGAMWVYQELQYERKQCLQNDNIDNMFDVKHEARVIKKMQSEFPGYHYLYERSY